MISIGHEVRQAIRDVKVDEGALSVVVPHAGAGLALLDMDDPRSAKKDELKKALEAYLVVAPVILPKSLNMPFEKGRFITEPWQDLFLIDYLKTGKRREYKVQVLTPAPKEAHEKAEQPF